RQRGDQGSAQQQAILHVEPPPHAAHAGQLHIHRDQVDGLGHVDYHRAASRLCKASMSPTLDGYRWLIGDEGERWLRQTAQDVQGKPATPALVRSLRTSLGVARTALVLEQVELRAKARDKFSAADNLFFTRRGLEQATDEQLANYKAQRFAEALTVADLCC